jgi:hypothetical protein
MHTDTRLMLATVALVNLVGLAAAQHSQQIAQPKLGHWKASQRRGETTTGQQGLRSTGSPWTPLTHQPSFLLDGASNPILLSWSRTGAFPTGGN